MRSIEVAYLSAKEAVAYTGVAFSTLAKMRMRGDGPEFCKIGAKVAYPRTDLDAWMCGRRQRSTSENAPRRSSR
ncbi:MAG TPA: helix-turn-helix domain-containing protein [Roseiarcus sp.]|nr:helix-turn-helix domain-containing protein [Roseiarcus sp.]